MTCCRYCQTTTNLVTEPWADPCDGLVTDEPIDICHDCVEHDYLRQLKRQEWAEYHDEPCPECELPQPAPAKRKAVAIPDHDYDDDDCWNCGGEGGRSSCIEDSCPAIGGEEGCSDPACWHDCDICKGTGAI